MYKLLAISTLLLSGSVFADAPSRILFGSCSHQDKDIPIFNSILKDDPEVFVFLGDNVYGDTEDMSVLQNKYEKLGAKPSFKELKEQAELIAIWDDHDYGANDAGKDYPKKEASRDIMLDFWGEPEDSPRRTREDGIYTSYTYGEGEESIHVILPDLRWNRDDVAHVTREEYANDREPKNMGPYKVHSDPKASMIGEKQWQWLEKELQKPARIKVIGSSLQLLADFTGWESWANFPSDRQRLFNLIKKHKVNGVILISGDTHWGEISYYDEDLDYPLWEVTSSGLTQEWKDVSPNKHRIGQFINKVNYGALDVDWEKDDPVVTLGLYDEEGDVVNEHRFRLSTLEPYE
ncbi:alkaline phosphatase D [Idiomarina loihiensis]|uniref:alkaline phosphatase D family protein n=1 Tax=Idiomarina TaxID=135575 RepID=UPI000D71B59F|nr:MULTISPECIES: alkaline phosphatase D family protein [Idiomarina]PWW36442.1 alkaline phosphatase D [Idiomarina loihiensis]TDP46500.1 alkaline phosphatase D [Idiomarina loihiensis]TDS22892.1 alkaline phosphatase D [Idiomarina sp. H2]